MQVNYFVDELKNNSVSFTFERGYENFKAYYNGKHIGDVSGGVPALRHGKSFETEQGDKISVLLKVKEKSQFLVEFNGIPVPSSPEYPAKKLKTAAIWSLVLGIFAVITFIAFVSIYPFTLNIPLIYIDLIIAVIYISCFFGIKRYVSIALYTPLALSSLFLLYFWIDPFGIYTGIFKLNLGVIIRLIAIYIFARSIKPMNQMQEIRRRLNFNKEAEIIDNI